MIASFTLVPSSHEDAEQYPLQHHQHEPGGERAPVEPTRYREHAAYRLDEPVRQRIGRPDPPSVAEVAEPPRDDPHDERGGEDSVRHHHREHHRPEIGSATWREKGVRPGRGR